MTRLSQVGWILLALLQVNCSPQVAPGLELSDLGTRRDGATPMGDGFSLPPPPPPNLPPLVVTSPARAAFLSPGGSPTVPVTGTGATAALQVNGQPVQAAGDGTFATAVTPTAGLNLVHVVDGVRTVDVPFLYGTYLPADATVGQAVALRINAGGFASGNQGAPTLSSLATSALAANDPLAPLKGQTFTGSLPLNGSWKFTVTGTKHGAMTVSLTPKSGGASANVTIANPEVDGNLTVNDLGQSPSGPVQLTMDSLVATGDVDASFDANSQSIQANMPSVQTASNNFQYHSNNGGWPCCVDGIMTNILKPIMAQTIHDQVQANLPSSLSLALSSFGLPSTVDLTQVGYPATLDLASAFDGASFDDAGATLTVGVAVTYPFGQGDPGSQAPGWWSIGAPLGTFQGGSSVGLAQTIDMINQALFTVWGQNGLAGDYPVANSMLHASPRLPPLLTPGPNGGLTIALGEIQLDVTLVGIPVQAAVTLVDDASLSSDPMTKTLSLVPAGNPTISFTWLKADGLSDALKQTFAAAASQVIAQQLQPMTLPTPSIPLDALGQPGEAAVLSPSGAPVVDGAGGRAIFYGDLALSP